MLRLQSVNSPSSSSTSPPTPPAAATPGGDRSPKSKMSVDAAASPNLVLRVKRKRGQHYVVNGQGQLVKDPPTAPGSATLSTSLPSSSAAPSSLGPSNPTSTMTSTKTSPTSRQTDVGASAPSSSSISSTFSKTTTTSAGRGTTISAGGGGVREAHRQPGGGLKTPVASTLPKTMSSSSPSTSAGPKSKTPFSSTLKTPSSEAKSLTSSAPSTSTSAAGLGTVTSSATSMPSSSTSSSTTTTASSSTTTMATSTATTTTSSADGSTTPTPTPAPAKHPLLALIHAAHPRPFPQAMPKPKPAEPAKQDVGIDTSESGVGTMTEPEFLGPCEPGTSVNLDGIVWHETDGGRAGLLVVNVTWRGKTYVGTLLDASKNDWAAPRFSEPTKPARGRGRKGRLPTSEGRVGGAAGRGKGRKGGKAAAAAAAAAAVVETETPSPAKSESRGSDAETDDVSLAKRFRLNSGESSELAPPGQYFECSESNCCKKFRNINGLKYHQSSSHPPEGVDPANFEDAEDGAGGYSSSRHRDRDHHRRDRDHHRHHHHKESRGGTPVKDANKSSRMTPPTSIASTVVSAASSSTTPAVTSVAISTAPPFGAAPPVVTVAPIVTPLAGQHPMPARTPPNAAQMHLPGGVLMGAPPTVAAGSTHSTMVKPEMNVSPGTPTSGVKHPASAMPDSAEKHKKPKLDKPGTLVKVRGTASIAPMKPIVPALQPRVPTTPGNNYQPVTTPASVSQVSPNSALKPIQPKPTILGEPSAMNPVLADLKEKKLKKKKLKEGELGHKGVSPKLSPPHSGGIRTGKTPPPTMMTPVGALSPNPGSVHGYHSDHHGATPSRSQGARTPTGASGPHTPGTPQPPNLDVMPQTLDKANVALHNANNPPLLLPGKEEEPPRLNSPAYSDISDPSDPAPVLENENAKKEDGEGSTGTERTYMPPFSPYYGQPPYLVPIVTTASSAGLAPGTNLVTSAGAPVGAPGGPLEAQRLPPPGVAGPHPLKDPRQDGLPKAGEPPQADPPVSGAPAGVPPPYPGAASMPQGLTQAQAAALYANNPYYYHAYYDAYCRHMSQVDPQYRAQYEEHMAKVQRQQEQQRAGASANDRKEGRITPSTPHGSNTGKPSGPPPPGAKQELEPSKIPRDEEKRHPMDANYQKRQSENHQILKENMEMKMQMTSDGNPTSSRPREFSAAYDPRDPRAMYQQTQEETRRYMDMVKNKSGVAPPGSGPLPSPHGRPPSQGERPPTSHPQQQPPPGTPGSSNPRSNPLPPHFHSGGDKRSGSPNHHPGASVQRSPYPPGGTHHQQSKPVTSMATPPKPRPSSPLASPRDLPPGAKMHLKDPRKDDGLPPSKHPNPNEPKDLSSNQPGVLQPRDPRGPPNPPPGSSAAQRPPSSSPIPLTSASVGQQPPPHLASYPPGYPIPAAAYAAYAAAGMPIEFYQRGLAPYASAAAAASPYARPFLPPGSQYPPGIPPGMPAPGQPPTPQRHPPPPRHPLEGKPGGPPVTPGGHPLAGSNTAIEMLKQQAENARQNHKIHELGQVGAAGSPAAPPGGHPPSSRAFDGHPSSMMRGSPSGLPPGHPGYALPPGYPASIIP